MPRITKAIAARNARIEQVIHAINDELGKEYGDALGHFAARYGIDWPTVLLDQWYSGQDAYFRDSDGKPLGHFLRQIRNSPKHGPAFYRAYNND